jgi:beta-lactamase superfamily II metal-dependent hydrolase
MALPAVTVEALPAAYGDSLLVTCALRSGVWRLLVDTGTDECWPSLKARLAQLPATAAGQRHIDLAVISHIDHDHIGAAGAMFSDSSLGLKFDDIWFNAPPRPVTRGVAEGASLSTLLGGTKVNLPWNVAWAGRPAVTPAEVPYFELPVKKGLPRITLLSPDPASLARLYRVWERELKRLGPPMEPLPQPAVLRGGPVSLEELANRKTATDRAPANGSSIAFLLEHKGVSVLLAADAHPTVLIPALKALAAHRGKPLPLQVDVCKLSHHGSRANVTVELMQAVQAQHYIVSTNGSIFGHPDEEAMARVIVKGGSQRKLWFNYVNDRTSRWLDATLRRKHGYSVGVPAPGKAQVSIELAARRAGARRPA